MTNEKSVDVAITWMTVTYQRAVEIDCYDGQKRLTIESLACLCFTQDKTRYCNQNVYLQNTMFVI